MIVTNSLSYALYLVFSKPAMARMSARRVIARMFAIASIVMLPIAAWPMLHEPWRAIPAGAWWSLAFVIIGPTVAAYLMNAWALKYAESSVVAAYTYLQPVFAVILAAIFLHEEIKPIALLAGAMIVAGVYLFISASPRLRVKSLLLLDPRPVIPHRRRHQRRAQAAHFRLLQDEEALVEERRQRRFADDHLVELPVDLGAPLGIVRAARFDDLRVDLRRGDSRSRGSNAPRCGRRRRRNCRSRESRRTSCRRRTSRVPA